MKHHPPPADRRKPITHRKLVFSLGRFVDPGDLFLPREQFLRAVLDRIVNYLSSPVPKETPRNQN
jgi:hypothetical protein